MNQQIGRRQLLAGAGAACLLGTLPGCGGEILKPTPARQEPDRLRLAPLRASTDRIMRITVCTRPFRAQGPRLAVEQIGAKSIVHNYGHGGSGWSLSWGSGAIAVQKALATGARQIGVIGCGALGLTSALLAQRAGAEVTIYAKDLPPNVRSSLATGVWSPDSRICLEQHATPAFRQTWEAMTRDSFLAYQNLLGLPANPVEFIDVYAVRDAAARSSGGAAARRAADDRPPFAQLQAGLVGDLMPRAVDYAPDSHTLGNRHLHRNTMMMFNLVPYSRLLVAEFLANGGKIVVADFHAVSELATLREATLINATGYGARALFNDRSIIPVRGQLARLIPQDDVRYGLFYRDVMFVPRRDGLVFQVVGDSDYYGFDDDSTVPDRSEAEHAVNTIAQLYG